MLTLRIWLAAATAATLVTAAGFAFSWGLPFFGVVLAVLAVFALVDITWVLRRRGDHRNR
ncbi:hypothetical protein ACVGVM_14175 [Pseudonocardia bannensis]|uniref:Uncharacterized protein n=1 Tax=Pseudonocardia bannensis TaxID=630973 RepID=A0A848DE56_9PSEU|nr:hypothetical protein [Pseudonocardia bannensis]NMH90851.1 hypothetical protein [Pseudonocardia bannensis]